MSARFGSDCSGAQDIWASALRDNGFRFVGADELQPCLLDAGCSDDRAHFADSWNDLEPDPYLAHVGRHRRRRYAVLSSDATGTIRREKHQPHYQALTHNALQGDIQRWFAPIRDDITDCAPLRSVLELCRQLFSSVDASALDASALAWHIELHQFRIEASSNRAGEPTPEGIHRDGVDYVMVLLIERQNIARGTTSIHLTDGSEVGSFTLTRRFDAAFVDDHRVFHGVTAVAPLDPLLPAYRDVLVVTFRRHREDRSEI